MKVNTVLDLLVHELQDIRSFEQQLTEGLPAMARAARNEQLRAAFTEHLRETTEQKRRVEQVLEQLKAAPGGVKCQGMAGVLREASEVMGFEGDADVKDLALIGAAQRVEHYEMAAYASAIRLAESLGLGKIAGTLGEVRDEEAGADEILGAIADQIAASADPARPAEHPTR